MSLDDLSLDEVVLSGVIEALRLCLHFLHMLQPLVESFSCTNCFEYFVRHPLITRIDGLKT